MTEASDILTYVRDLVAQLAELSRAVAPDLAADLDAVVEKTAELLEA